MDRRSAKYLNKRSQHSELHSVSIRNDTQKIYFQISKLVDEVFGHLPAVYGGEFKDLNKIDVEDIPSIEWISLQLYMHHFVRPKLHRDYDGVQLTDNAFLEILTNFSNSKNRNQLFFLLGTIGCGKTAFINNLITKYAKTCFDKSKCWFIRVNVDVNSATEESDTQEFYKLLSKKTISILEKMGARGELTSENDKTKLVHAMNKLKSSISRNGDEKELQNEVCDLIKETSAVIQRRPIIILDNLDYFFHENDRYMFLSSNDTLESNAMTLIQNIVGSFYHGLGCAGDLGANIVFVLRPDSYAVLRATKALFPGTENPYSDNRSLFTIKAPDWRGIITERTELLKVTIAAIKKTGLKKSANRSVLDLVNALESDEKVNSLVGHLKELVPFGLRSVMTFFKRYIWLNDYKYENYPATTRYIKNYPVGLMAFMLDNRRLYSQRESNFPNIFLCNIEAAEEEFVKNEVLNRGVEKIHFTKDHGPTYWLKIFLLIFIRNRNRRGLAVTTADIVDVFCYKRYGFYDESLVRLCLGNFSQTHKANLIEVQKTISLDKKRLEICNIKLTDRAIHCLDDIFFRFFYLQLIVDDFDLPLPDLEAFNDFIYDKERHYGYLVADKRSYLIRSVEMIRHKSRLVIKLLALLEITFDWEVRRYSGALERVKEEGCELPKPLALKASFIEECEALKFARLSYVQPGEDLLDIEKLENVYSETKIQLSQFCRILFEV